MIFGAQTSIRAKLAALAGFPVVGALLLALFVAHDARQRATSAAALGSIEDLARLTGYIADVLHAVQDERAVAAIVDGSSDAVRRSHGAGGASQAAHDTTAAAERLEGFLSNRDRSKLPARLERGLVESEAALHGLEAVRSRVGKEVVPLQDVLASYDAASTHLVGATAALAELSDDGAMLRNISATVALLELEERSSREQAIVGFAAAHGEFPPGAYKALVTTVTEQGVYDEAFRTSASDDVRQEFEAARERGADARTMLDAVLGSTEDAVSVDPAAWSLAQGAALRELRGAEHTLLGRIETVAASKGAELRRTIRLSIGVSIAVILLSVSLAIFVGRGVGGSVRALADAAGRVRASRDFSVRAQRVSDDELGVLTETFNDMLAGIQSRDAELEQHRSHLEGLVVARTRELDARNAALRLVLDHVDQGLATIGLDGTLGSERSAAFERWFGSAATGSFSGALGASDDRLRLQLELGWAQVADGFLPYEVSVEQLPKRFDRDDRHFGLSVKLISDERGIAGGLLVVTDITAELEARKEQARQREEIQVFRRLARDRSAFVAFLEETGGIVDRLRHPRLTVPEQLGLVHTIKGNAAQYEARSVAELAHELESAVADAEGPLLAGHWGPLLDAWDALVRHVSPLVGAGDAAIELSSFELERLIRDATAGVPHAQLAARLRMLVDEPVATRFARLGDHAERLASRLGKPVPAFTIQTDDLRLPRHRYAPFWAGLVHVVRNAVDHGIESASDRLAAGKPARGSVAFRARLEDASVVIEVADDGAGIDWDRLAVKARSAGLPTGRRDDLERAMFASGISSLEKVTDVSGRGVGLAAVWDTTADLGGTVRVESVRGRETRFVFRLPLADERVDARAEGSRGVSS
jgi:two-component system chemotaxis sensor kinase CheA